ncbi:MAG: twin-arginine translocation pathway signal protein [Thermomicrobiales bacterium]|nr:twin-arginine translocation pathway signal protein [Thermomicrobiales bacterium]
MSRRQFLAAVSALAATVSFATHGLSASAQEGDRKIRTLRILSNPQANSPEEFESSTLSANQISQLGLTVELDVQPNEQLSNTVWYERDVWDMTAWQMVGRPERLDPDEFIVNLFSSGNAENGYNFVGYINPTYDEVAQAQRAEVDLDARQALVWETQAIVSNDQPYVFWAYPDAQFAYNHTVWDPATIVDAKGIGIKNYWTFVGGTPLGDQTDFILNCLVNVTAINPFYISGGVDSWVTDLIYDRVMRVGADGLPTPSAAESVEWVDNLTCNVTLKEGLTFHDGAPVTPEDIVFSFTAPSGDMVPMYKPFVASIESISYEGNVITFKLVAPNAAFETSSLSKLNIVPKHIWEPILAELEANGQIAEAHQEDAPVGSGPYKFSNWARSQELILEAVPDHYAAPKATRWILRDIPNVAAALGGLQAGEINFLSDYTGDPQLLQQTIQSSSDMLTLVSTTQVGFKFLAPNHRRPPFGDQAFRLAMSVAVGKDQIVANIYKGFASVANSVVSKALEFWHNTDIELYDVSDIEGAKAILQAAGYEWDADGALLYPAGTTETL